MLTRRLKRARKGKWKFDWFFLESWTNLTLNYTFKDENGGLFNFLILIFEFIV